ncbi:conserved hypothetical protein [Burkholderia sp. 8Y]|nr:conserved hypothetical protein [Burkholderia sp. 8Y]
MQSKLREEDIRTRAYLLWEADGRHSGRDHVYWQQAIAQLKEEGVAPSRDPAAGEHAASDGKKLAKAKKGAAAPEAEAKTKARTKAPAKTSAKTAVKTAAKTATKTAAKKSAKTKEPASGAKAKSAAVESESKAKRGGKTADAGASDTARKPRRGKAAEGQAESK